MIRKKVLTTNREIYNKFTMLNFTGEIILETAKLNQINRILKSINSKEKILSSKKIGNYFLIKKIRPLNFDIYFR